MLQIISLPDYPLHRVAKELKVPVISREHRVPEFTFGAKANLWDYRVDGISTREEDENSKTANMALEDISEDDFREKDRLVHQELIEYIEIYLTQNMRRSYSLVRMSLQRDPLRAMQSLGEFSSRVRLGAHCLIHWKLLGYNLL